MEHGARLEDKIFGAPSFKQQAPSLTSFKLQDIIGEEREGNMSTFKEGFIKYGLDHGYIKPKKKIDHNNLLPYFTDHHADLPVDYLESCEEFFIKLIKENKVKYDSIKKEK